MVRVITSPLVIPAAGYPPKQISEFIGRMVSGTPDVSIAMMKSPPGWTEPGQIPGFDEYSLVLSGILVITTRTGEHAIHSGQTAIAPAGEWVRYSSPDGAEYIAVCIPGFSPDLVHRDDDSAPAGYDTGSDATEIIYEETDREGLNRIEDLWDLLREHHASHSRNFAQSLKARSFSQRRDEILRSNDNRYLLVQTARISRSKKPVGFCVSSAAPGGIGEIESIFVEPGYRSRGIGTTFVQRACSWMQEKGSEEMGVGVCEGNEESFRFYQRFGFYLRRHYLLRKND